MKRTLVVVLLLILPFISFQERVSAQKETVKPREIVEAKKLDNKAKILAQYLSGFDSPMQSHAQDFIDASDAYNLDWKLLPSIAGVESTFGKEIPGGYNAWGWGVYGDQAIYFNSWREGMFTIAKGLRENYLDRGLADPYSINRIYAASPYWGGRVSWFMADLEKFANGFKGINHVSLGTTPKIAAVSGQPAMR